MKRLTVFAIIFSMGTLFAMVTGSLTLGRLFAAESTPAPQMVCYLNDDRYVLDLQVIPSPTRIVIPTVTPLPEPTRTAVPTLAPTVRPCLFTGTVTASKLNVRTAPSADAPIVAVGSPLVLGQSVCVVSVSGGWYEVRQGGWVSANWIEVKK